MGRLRALGLVLAVALSCSVGPAQAQTWSRTTLPSEVYWAHDVASTGIGESVLLHRTIDGTFATPYPFGAQAGSRQQLDSGWNFYPTVDASAAGGAVAAWYDEDEVQIRVAERPASGGEFTVTRSVSGGRSDYSYGHPLVRVNERGDAIVVYLAEVAGGTQQVRALYRPASGEFAPSEPVDAVAPWSTAYPRDVALAPDGTAVVGVVRAGAAHVAVRPPSGPFAPPVRVSSSAPEHSWQSPRVGIDAFGDIVVAWLEEAPSNDTGPVRVAFRRAGEAAFGPPQETGLRATSYGRIELGVSAVGEVALLVEAQTTNPYGGTHLEGLHVAMGNALVGKLGPEQAITDIWGSYPSFAMNARGDAVVVYDECCPMAVRTRRRAPLTGFGPVEDVQPPIHFEGSRYGIIARDADVDEFGNARVTYEDGELDEAYLATALPFVDVEPPAVPELGDLISSVLAVLPQPDDPILPEVVSDPPVAGFVPPPPALPLRASSRAAPPVVADRAAPALTLRVAGALARGRRPRLVTRAGCSEACVVRISGTFAGRRIRPVEGWLQRAGTLRLGLPLSRRALRGRRARVARLTAVATDAAGNTATRRRTVTVRPAR